MLALVLHGMFCTAWHVGRLVEGLRGGGMQAQALPLPGRGDGRVRLVDWVNCATAAVRAADEPLALVGHSTGGLAALLAAARLPGLARLLLLSPAAPAEVNAFTWANVPVFLPGVLGGGRALPSPARYGALFMNRQDEALRRQVYPRLVAEPRAFVRDVALPWLHPQGAAHLRFAERPGFPIRILVGDADRATPPRVQRALAARVPGAELEVLNAPDHYGMIEGVGAGDVLARALAFLKD